MSAGLRRAAFAVVALAALSAAIIAQEPGKKKPEASEPEHVRASAAFAELIFRAAVLEAELEELLIRYTDEFPKVVEKRFELSRLEAAIKRLSEVPEEESSKLTLALGKMLVQQAVYATELDGLKRRYSDTHPEVKRAARKLEIFDKAVARIL